MRLSKTAIDYFERRLDHTIRSYQTKFNALYLDKEFTNEQKIKEILSGKARVNEVHFKKNDCPYGRLLDFFDYSDKGATKNYNDSKTILASQMREEMTALKGGHVDEFVYDPTREKDIIETFIAKCEPVFSKYIKKIKPEKK